MHVCICVWTPARCRRVCTYTSHLVITWLYSSTSAQNTTLLAYVHVHGVLSSPPPISYSCVGFPLSEFPIYSSSITSFPHLPFLSSFAPFPISCLHLLRSSSPPCLLACSIPLLSSSSRPLVPSFSFPPPLCSPPFCCSIRLLLARCCSRR